MNYQSTRNSKLNLNSAEVILKGISEDGGLFVPEFIPKLTKEDMISLIGMDYRDRAKFIFGKYLSDFTDAEISECVESAYKDNFDDSLPCHIVKLGTNSFIMELWHGPTCAFKDVALQILPRLLVKAMKKTGKESKAVILTATSGDTGKAALEGFEDVEDTEIIVFYPENGVSKIQKLQMQTQNGKNVTVCGVEGNFDDTQSSIKKVFTDEKAIEILKKFGKAFSSANSINWGRLLPQIVYYISSYLELVSNDEIKLGEKINIAVPTGNFGNILAAYYAMKMGIPVNKLICASNANNVLTDFLSTGIYDVNRKFYLTESPSMDILISSNLERLLYEFSDRNDIETKGYMNGLFEHGKYEVSDVIKQKSKEIFYAGYCDDDFTEKKIKEIFEKYSYLCDTHTAVAISVYDEYKKITNDNTKTLIASTASPYKFPKAVLKAISNSEIGDDFSSIKLLEKISGLKAPIQLVSLDEKEIRFNDICRKEDIFDFVIKSAGGES